MYVNTMKFLIVPLRLYVTSISLLDNQRFKVIIKNTRSMVDILAKGNRFTFLIFFFIDFLEH